MTIQRPTWLPKYLPELDGLRGLAILGVVVYHCGPLLENTWMHNAAQWGWTGVNLFFVLSGFLITTILLESRDRPRYFRNFFGRRALRIWPVYLLVLAVVYLNAPWFVGASAIDAIKAAPWLAYFFLVQNLFHLALPAAIVPTWALAIEHQYYLLWAPLVRFVRRPWMLAAIMTGALVTSPLLRHLNPVWLWGLPTHTLIKFDGIALGSLLALALYTLQLSRRAWFWIGLSLFVLGMGAAATVAGGTSLLDTALAAGFAGAVVAAMATTGARNPLSTALRSGPLAFYGRISYGLYMTHIMVFIFFGWFDIWMKPFGMAGNLAVVAVRLAVTTAFASALWYGFEAQVFKLKCFF